MNTEQENGSGQAQDVQDALTTAEARLRLALQAANIGFWEWDIRSNSVYHSPEWKQQLGFGPDELSNEIGEWQSRLHPDDKLRVLKVVEDFFKRPRSGYDVEFRLRHRDGSYRWIRSQGLVLRDRAGAPLRMLGVHVDITVLKARELERTRAAEEYARLAAIVETSNDAILGEDREGIITSWNRSAERIYGYTAAEAIGRSVRMLVPRDKNTEVNEILERMRQGEMIEHLETRRVRKDGREIHVSLVVSPIRDAQGRVVGGSAIARDITDRKLLEAEVLRISEREQQRIAQDLHDGLGQLLSGTAHLSAALQGELAEQALPEAADAMRITELLNQSVAEARSLARGLYPVRPEPNGLFVAIQELSERTQRTFSVACSFRCRKPVLIADPGIATHLYQIAREAVANAVKHGGARRIDLSLSATRHRVVLQIRDNGSGLPPRDSGWKGLGIRIMRYRAEMIGGHLQILNRSRCGVSVVCTLPRPPLRLCERKANPARIS